MPRPDHIPVCRLSHALPLAQPTLWRRAQAGTYGAITRDARGRQQVELIEVEIAEGRTFSDVQLAKMLGTPATNVVNQRQRRERLRSLIPPPMQVMIPPGIYEPNDIRGLIFGFLARRDAAWASRLNAVINSRNSKSQL